VWGRVSRASSSRSRDIAQTCSVTSYGYISISSIVGYDGFHEVDFAGASVGKAPRRCLRVLAAHPCRQLGPHYFQRQRGAKDTVHSTRMPPRCAEVGLREAVREVTLNDYG